MINPGSTSTGDPAEKSTGLPLVGDARNDTHLFISQLHLAFLHFHNRLADRTREEGTRPDEVFDAAARMVRWHYQWIANEWQCEVVEVKLVPGHVLELYTDEITEAHNAEGEEFGESRLLDTLRSHCHLPVGPLLQAVVGAVQQFTGGEQQDEHHLGDRALARIAP